MVRHRSSKSAPAQLLDAAPTPVYVLDDHRRIVFANRALLEWMRARSEEILGVRCDYHSDINDTSAEARVAGLCPPPNAWDEGEHQVEVVCRVGDEWRRGLALCLGFRRADRQGGGVLVVIRTTDWKPRGGAQPGHDGEPGHAAQLHSQLVRLREEVQDRYAPDRFWGTSLAIRQTRKRLDLAIQSGANVLISGPAGSGREHVARSIHAASDAWDAVPMVTLSCPLLDDELLDTTVKALMQRSSELQLPHPPCLLLLDVDQLPEVAQRSLVATLQLPDLDLRALATSSANRVALSARDDFREDLAMLLSTVEIELPPLCDRRQDIPLLIQGELERVNRQGGKQVQGVTPEAMEYWLAYDWPANVDELFELVREAHRMATGPWISPDSLPERLRHAREAVRYSVAEKETIQLDAFLEEIEKELIGRALTRARGNKSEAARLLGIGRARLLRRIAQLRLDA